jgi:hypothetical protein
MLHVVESHFGSSNLRYAAFAGTTGFGADAIDSSGTKYPIYAFVRAVFVDRVASGR